MRQFFLRAIVLGLAISLSGCLARPMATVSAGDASARSASLSVRLAPADGMRLLAPPPAANARCGSSRKRERPRKSPPTTRAA